MIKLHKYFVNWFNKQINLTTKYFWPAVISAIAAKRQSDKNRKATDSANQQNIANSKEFAQNSIKWRVEDAKNSGIHPLYALGASSIQPSANIEPQVSDYADSIGKLSRSMSKNPIEKAQLRKLNLESDLIQENIEASRASRIKMAMNTSQDAETLGQENMGKNMIGMGDSKTKVGPMTSAQAAEDQYGEVGGLLFGLRNFFDDYDFFNAKPKAKRFANRINKQRQKQKRLTRRGYR